MAFQYSPSAFVIVGGPGGRQVIIDPSQTGQISFPNPSGFSAASIGTGVSALTESLNVKGPDTGSTNYGGVDLNATSINDDVSARLFAQSHSNSVGISVGANSVGNNVPEIIYSDFPARAGFIPGIINSSSFGGSSGAKWLMQVTFHTQAVTAGVNFNAILPIAFPSGEGGAFAWVSFLGNPGFNITVQGMFPGGAHNQIQLQCTVTGNPSFGLISICHYA